MSLRSLTTICLFVLLAIVAAMGCGSDDASPQVVDPGGLGGQDSGGTSQGGSSGAAGTGGLSGHGGQAGSAGSAGQVAGSGGDGGQGGSGGLAGSAGEAGSSQGGTGGTVCTDVYPYTDGYTCAEQAGWGKCAEDWLLDYCDISCGRCGGGPDCAAVGSDPCPMPTGLYHACARRFALGINYAWRSFGADFGGLPQWNQKSVSQDPDPFDADLAKMRANGVSVVRWWMFPDFRGAGVTFDSFGDPIGITDTVRNDILKALELAHKNHVHLVLTIFSFDNFRPDRTTGGVLIRGMSPMVVDPTRRTRLIQNIVIPVARAAASSPYVANLLGWDVVNEPEWAISSDSSAPFGRDFSPMDDLDPVSLADMKSLIGEMLATLAVETPSVSKSVGWAAAKWSWAFTDLTRVDFHQPHIYAWVNVQWPYYSTPAQLGYEGRPTVIGECYLQANPFSPDPATFHTAAESFFGNGYAGMWAWDFFSGNVQAQPDPSFDITLIQSFASSHACQVSF